MLLKFFTNKNSRAYLRGLAEEFGESTNSVRYELNNLSEAGYLVSQTNGRTIEYRANTTHPLFPEIKSVVHKYLGIDKIAETIVEKLGTLRLAFITGDYAEGRDSGLVDLILVGAIDRSILQKCEQRAESLINRKIRSLVLSEREFEEMKEKLGHEKAIILWSTLPGIEA